MIIERYFKVDTEIFNSIVKNLKLLISIINNSCGEYSLQLREDSFNVYYRGNSIADVNVNKNGTYSISIHTRFCTNILDNLREYSSDARESKNKKYYIFKVLPETFHQFLQKKHITKLASNIRDVNAGEETAFEQVLITDNPPNLNFIIIDRQIQDHGTRGQIDLIALKRETLNEPFHFIAIENKLGRNVELNSYVADQIYNYVQHIRLNIIDYINCYKENYRQKKILGLFEPYGTNFPEEIEIDDDINTVQGLIIVGGYSQLADRALKNLRPIIQEKCPEIKIQQMRRIIEL
jgi:hypothetical protein